MAASRADSIASGRGLAELVDRDDPGLPLLRGWAGGRPGNVLLPPDEGIRDRALVALQVTTRSILGAIAYETGGMSAADGLVRLLGSGVTRSIDRTNEAAGLPLGGGVLLIGDDALGGLFALNGGGLGRVDMGGVFHLAADDLAWRPLGAGHGDFVRWCLAGDVAELYDALSDLEAYRTRPRPAFHEAYAFYPFLWTREAKEGPVDARVIDADEALRLRLEICGLTTG